MKDSMEKLAQVVQQLSLYEALNEIEHKELHTDLYSALCFGERIGNVPVEVRIAFENEVNMVLVVANIGAIQNSLKVYELLNLINEQDGLFTYYISSEGMLTATYTTYNKLHHFDGELFTNLFLDSYIDFRSDYLKQIVEVNRRQALKQVIMDNPSPGNLQ